MDDRMPTGEQPDEQQLGDLIRGAGRRERPGAAAVAAARAAAAAEWRTVVAARARRRHDAQRWSAVAAVAVTAVAVWIAWPQGNPAVAVASVERVSGTVEAGGDGWLSRREAVVAGATLSTDTKLRAGAASRVALRYGGLSLRLDEQSVVALTAPGHVELRRGALYVDSRGDTAATLVIDTPYGAVSHLGTQYETRLGARALRVSVREGRVRIAAAGEDIEGRAGEQLTLAANGAVKREHVGPDGGAWAWTQTIAPEFDIDGHALLDFLRWVSRETGRELAFATPAAEQAAGTLVLRGSIRGMSPEQALAAVLTTTELQASADGGTLRIDFKADGR